MVSALRLSRVLPPRLAALLPGGAKSAAAENVSAADRQVAVLFTCEETVDQAETAADVAIAVRTALTALYTSDPEPRTSDLQGALAVLDLISVAEENAQTEQRRKKIAQALGLIKQVVSRVLHAEAEARDPARHCAEAVASHMQAVLGPLAATDVPEELATSIPFVLSSGVPGFLSAKVQGGLQKAFQSPAICAHYDRLAGEHDLVLPHLLAENEHVSKAFGSISFKKNELQGLSTSHMRAVLLACAVAEESEVEACIAKLRDVQKRRGSKQGLIDDVFQKQLGSVPSEQQQVLRDLVMLRGVYESVINAPKLPAENEISPFGYNMGDTGVGTLFNKYFDDVYAFGVEMRKFLKPGETLSQMV